MNYKAIIPTDISYFLDGFRKDLYPIRFEDYCHNAKPVLLALPADAEPAADQLIAWMDSRVTGFFRKRKRLDQELLLMQYTIPAAIRCGRQDFAHALHNRWNAVHPDYSFGIATFEEFYKNFNTTLLGIKIDRGDD